MGDGSKYLEGNYSKTNPFRALKEYWEDLKQSQELENDEEYMTAILQYLKDKREEHHYLVDGAVLRCTCCTMTPQQPLEKVFEAPEGSDEVLLKVTQNKSMVNGAGQYFATVKDSKKFVNIPSFGNCKNLPDREEEEAKIMMAEESDELRKLGTCACLMELNDTWENMISAVGYEEIPGEDGRQVETVTMESILFCKHGGFIYPVDSGYAVTETEIETDYTECNPSDPEMVQKYMWDFFIDAGFSKVCVAGIIGNAHKETGGTFNPEIISSSGYYGIFQWGGKRKEELEERETAWEEENGWSDSDWENKWKKIELQCQFALDEYNGKTESRGGWGENKFMLNGQIIAGTKKEFENAQSASEAARIWALNFERCIEKPEVDQNGNILYYKGIQGEDDRLLEAEKAMKLGDDQS